MLVIGRSLDEIVRLKLDGPDSPEEEHVLIRIHDRKSSAVKLWIRGGRNLSILREEGYLQALEKHGKPFAQKVLDARPTINEHGGLVLSRPLNSLTYLIRPNGDGPDLEIAISIERLTTGGARLGFTAPDQVVVVREELYLREVGLRR